MPDVLMIGDTERSASLRHEVPVQITDPFVYAETGGGRHVVIWNFEIDRIRATGADLDCHPMEELRFEELVEQGLDQDAALRELALRAVRLLGLERATVPREFPLGYADHLRANGIELTVDQRLFDDRRRVKSPQELEGIRSAQRSAEAGMAAALELLRAGERRNGGLALDGEPLTCELLKEHVARAFDRHGCTAEEFIVSHGAQTAVGHDMGSGPIGADDVVMLDLFPKHRESACFADMTRTFAVGEIPDEIRTYHRHAREALERCVEAIRPGLEGKELHRLVCEHFEAHGYPTQLSKPPGEILADGFYHATGHVVGLSVHEQPGVGRIGEAFVAGDVLAIEPGLYRNGFGGVRLEDLVLVTDDGCEVLTDFPYDLEVAPA
jgi:Xaa-Pro aminopeptidase